MATVLSIVNQKGGVGKTTVTFNLGAALARKGARVLLIDNDPQGNLSSYCGVEPTFTIDEVYVARRPLVLSEQNLCAVDNGLSLLAADSMLSGVEYYLATRENKESILRQALGKIHEIFDTILIDNPPALNLLTVNGLMSSDGVLVPVQPEFFSLEGIVALEKTIESLKSKNPVLSIRGIIVNMFDDRRKLNWEVWNALKSNFGDKVLETRIHNCVKIAESSGHGKSVLKYSPSSRSSLEFQKIAEEFLDHGL